MSQKFRKIAFQGFDGANSHMACRNVYPDLEVLPSLTFEDAFRAVQDRQADLAMIPVDNNLAGRVADVHHLIPKAGLYIIGEYFLPIRFALMGLKGAKTADLKQVYSHVHAFPQCRGIVKKLGLQANVHADTAGAAKYVSELGDKTKCALAPPLAADMYGLEIFENDVQDSKNNMTRFLVLSREMQVIPYDENQKVLSSLVFRVRNIPAALYKALGGFATNGLNLAKIESYVDEYFQAAQFYIEVEGHPESRLLKLALQELAFFADEVRILGTYPAHSFRKSVAKAAA